MRKSALFSVAKTICSIIFICCISAQWVVAQEYNVWMYSRMGLDFSTEPPTFYNNTKANADIVRSSVCDEQGKLLFYGGYVDTPFQFSILDRAGGYIQPPERQWYFGSNDRYFSLYVRGNDSLYYFFYYASSVNPKGGGLFYTLINRNLNGGLGGVVPFQKDILVYPIQCTGITATMNTDSTWWIITRSYDSLLAVKVDKNGVHPAISTYAPEFMYRDKYIVPNVVPDFNRLRISNDGGFMAAFSMYLSTYSKSGKLQQSHWYNYNFNKSTGKFFNQKLIEVDTALNVNRYKDAAFSSNDSILYVGHDNYFIQCNRYSNDIKGTAYYLWDRSKNDFLQINFNNLNLGQNGRLYVGSGGGGDDISLIYYPNKWGSACKMLPNAIKINCNLGVNGNGCSSHNFPFSRYHGLGMGFAPQPQCDSTLKLTNLCDKSKFIAYKWYIYATNGNTYKDSAEAETPLFLPPAQGKYWVKVQAITPKGYGPWYSDTVTFEYPKKPRAGFYTKTKNGCRYVAFQLFDSSQAANTNPPNAKSWHWFFGDGKDSVTTNGNIAYTYTQTGTYDIKLVYNDGYCSDTAIQKSIIAIVDAPKPGITIKNNNTCQPAPITFKRTFADTITKITYDFGDGTLPVENVVNGIDVPQNHTYNTPGSYVAKQTIEGPTGCVTTDSVEVNIFKGFEEGQMVSLQQVTLIDSTRAQIDWENTDNAYKYEIYRSTDTTNVLNWRKLQSIHGALKTFFDDYIVNTEKQVYYYKVVAYDTCHKYIESNKGSTIVLEGKNFDNQYAVVNWTPYVYWQHGVAEYKVQAYDEIVGQWVDINSATTLEFKDNNFAEGQALSKRYRIEAIENMGTGQSISNEIVLPVAPVVWIPNAFSPNGDMLNDSFSLVTLGVEELSIKIFNSYGEMVFDCDGVNCFWDGNHKGKLAPEGVYTYTIKGRGVDRRLIVTNGTVHLLR